MTYSGWRKRLLTALPYDAWALGREQDRLADAIRQAVNRHRYLRFPGWLRPLARAGLRALWLAWCPVQAFLIIRRRHRGGGLSAAWLKAVGRAWLYGEPAMQTLPALAQHDVGHLHDHHLGKLWQALGDPKDRWLAQDKLALARVLDEAGFPVPRLLQECPQGKAVDPAAWPWPDTGTVFVKPRHGSRAGGAMSIGRLDAATFVIDGERRTGTQELVELLAPWIRRDNLLVQPMLRPLATLSDLAPDSPPELRITTAHVPHGEAFVCSCYMKIQAPGKHASTILNGAVAIPVDLKSGAMEFGIRLNQPHLRLDHIPWNGARISDRSVPEFAAVSRMISAAADCLPGLAVIGWDVLLTASGPVILEANTVLSWRLIQFGRLFAGRDESLRAVIEAWLAHSSPKQSAAADTPA